MFIDPEIEVTADGSQTLRHPLSGDTYHSLNGAVAESEHVFIRNGLLSSGKNPVRILEVGFGSGLNAWLTMKAAGRSGITVEYNAVELYPVGPQTIRKTAYAADPLFVALHGSPWDVTVDIAPWFTLHKIWADLASCRFDVTFDLVYFDAFAPDTQPELWSGEIFEKIYAAMAPEAILVTYSSKGEVKRTLRSAGFEVSRLPGAPGKRHMLRAVKHK